MNAMADFPALPLWTDAYLADTRHLSHAEHGRYLLMLMDMWRMPEKRFPNDDAWLARKFGCAEHEVDELFRPLIREFFQSDGNWICQKRLTREWHRLKKTTQRQSDNAKARWNKENDGSHGSTTVALPPQPYTPKEESKRLESHTNVVDISPKPERGTNIVASGKPKQPRTKHAYPPGFEKFWAAYPQRGTDSKSSAFTAWDKAQKNENVPEHELQDACERYATYAAQTDCQTMLVQTWCNRRCWTSSYHIGSHDNGKEHKREDWYGRRILERAVKRAAEAEAEPCSDFPELESRAARW